MYHLADLKSLFSNAMSSVSKSNSVRSDIERNYFIVDYILNRGYPESDFETKTVEMC